MSKLPRTLALTSSLLAIFAFATLGCSSTSGSGGGAGSGGTASGGAGNGGSAGNGNGGSAGASGSISSYCSTMIASTPVCYVYKDFPAQSKSTLDQTCTSTLKGQVVPSCPTTGIVGCCKLTTNGSVVEQCFYKTQGDAGMPVDAGSLTDVYKQSCTSQKGTWSKSM